MHKELFLKQLEENLAQLPPEEIRTRLDYYAEILADMQEDGMTEQQAVEKLGDPVQIAAQILKEMPMATLVKTRLRPEKGWTTTAVVLAIAGAPLWVPLTIAAVSVIGAMYLVLWSLALSVYATVLALAAGGIGMVIHGFTVLGLGAGPVLLNLGAGLLFLALAILGGVLSFYVTKGILRGTRWIFAKTKQLFIK